MYTKKWVLETTRYFCDLGFFEGYSNLPDEELFEIMTFLERQLYSYRNNDGLPGLDYYSNLTPEQLIEISCQTPIVPIMQRYGFDEAEDWQIIELDGKRVICADAEFLYFEKWPPYKFEDFVKLLEKLSKISRGKFITSEIVESGEQQISFKLNKIHCRLIPNGAPDDPLILACDVNPALLETGYQFEQLRIHHHILLMLLSEDEKQKLMQDRGWEFSPDYSMFDPNWWGAAIMPPWLPSTLEERKNRQLHSIELRPIE
ncbi:MAG: hypothetical protein F6K24_40155 [Okeania sp. SIO2D1]|uniref:hypothetical protein n=1 Tax=Okeania sp. SIO2C9 TaxID=2607791 RepID=UPI0013BDE61E|nr:hypothetical protein [Okeania sp. SIO2C9]NEQ74332.1 hypothetical protein [Okeania sp. SIO2C9]NES70990.1 hypothetical protein [Okeania sp. SIO2D1]